MQRWFIIGRCWVRWMKELRWFESSFPAQISSNMHRYKLTYISCSGLHKKLILRYFSGPHLTSKHKNNPLMQSSRWRCPNVSRSSRFLRWNRSLYIFWATTPSPWAAHTWNTCQLAPHWCNDTCYLKSKQRMMIQVSEAFSFS